MENIGSLLMIGLIFLACSIGCMYTPAIGCAVFGGGCIGMGLIAAFFWYLSPARAHEQVKKEMEDTWRRWENEED